MISIKNKEQNALIKEIKKKIVVRNHKKAYLCNDKQKVTRTQRKHHSSSKNRISVGSKDNRDLGHKNHATSHPIGKRLWATPNLYKYSWKCNISCNSNSRQSCMFESLLISSVMLQASLPFLSFSLSILHYPRILHPVISSKLPPILAAQILSFHSHSPINDHPHLLIPPSSMTLFPDCHIQDG